MDLIATTLLIVLALSLILFIVTMLIFFYFSSYYTKFLQVISDFNDGRTLVTERYKK